MQQNFFMKAVTTDMEQSVRQGDAATIAHELSIQVHPWGFDLSDFRIRKRVPPSGIFHRVRRLWKQEEEVWEGFNAPIHIWQVRFLYCCFSYSLKKCKDQYQW
jgi:hypothetical protein